MSTHADTDPIARLASWIDIPSTTGDEHAYIAAIEASAEADGWQVHRQPVVDGRDNLLITATGAVPSVLFSTHVDTVPPHIPSRIERDAVYGRGACDTKGIVVAMLEAARTVRETHGDRAAGLLLVVGEEVDHCGAIAARELALDGVRHIVLGEPTRNRLVSHQKGLLKCVVETAGVAGHSAFPDRGRSAVEPLLEILRRVRTEPWGSHDVLGPTTVNVGLLQAGVAANVFAPAASATLMIRLSTPSQGVLDRIHAFAATAHAEVPPLVGADGRVAIAPPRVDVLTQLDPLELHVPAGAWPTTTASFNSDAVYLTPHAPVTLVGPGDIEDAHADHEHIDIAEFRAGIERYRELADVFLAS